MKNNLKIDCSLNIIGIIQVLTYWSQKSFFDSLKHIKIKSKNFLTTDLHRFSRMIPFI